MFVFHENMCAAQKDRDIGNSFIFPADLAEN